MPDRVMLFNPALFAPKPLPVRVTRLKCPTCGWTYLVPTVWEQDREALMQIWDDHLYRAVVGFKSGT